MTVATLTTCYRCRQCSDLTSQITPLGEWLCYPCINVLIQAKKERGE